MADRLLIVGLDAGTFDILDAYIASGDMPNLATVFSQSALAELESTFPPTTSPAWPAMMTGLGPGKLGFFGLLNRKPGTQYEFFVARNTFDRRSLWSMAGHAGVPAVSCGVPGAFPPAESPNTTVVTGMLTPNNQPRTAPQNIEEVLIARNLIIDWEELRDLDGSVALPDDEAALALHMMDSVEWRVFVTVFRSSDGIYHTHPAEPEAHREMFRRIDRHIGEMRTRLDDNDTLMLVSDHGMTRLEAFLNINSLLWREGLLARRDRPHSVEDRALGVLDRIKRSPLFDNSIVKNRVTRGLAESLRQRRAAKTLDFGREGKRQPRLSEALIDWSATECFFVDLGYGSGVYLNLKGREPYGIVDPGEYEAVRDKVSAVLGSQAGVVVRKREDVYSGPLVDRAPDLLVSHENEAIGLSGRLLDVPVHQPVETPYFHHTRRGIWAVAGPDVVPGRRTEAASIVDVCPTALHLLGLGVPGDVDGVVRTEFFRNGSSPASRPVVRIEAPAGSAGDVEEYDDESIKEKLRGLGYMH